MLLCQYAKRVGVNCLALQTRARGVDAYEKKLNPNPSKKSSLSIAKMVKSWI
jgi:hypothetical protein